MKQTLLLYMLLPFSTLAQSEHGNQTTEHQSLKVHYQKISMHNDNMTLTNGTAPGEMSFAQDNGDINISGPLNVKIVKAKKQKSEIKDWIIVADKVEIIGTQNPSSVKADMLSYDSKTKTGVLYGHVTLIEKGAKKQIGKRAEVDFCNDEYRIVSIK